MLRAASVTTPHAASAAMNARWRGSVSELRRGATRGTGTKSNSGSSQAGGGPAWAVTLVRPRLARFAMITPIARLHVRDVFHIAKGCL